VRGLHRTRPLGGYCRARHLWPDLESVGHFLAVLGGGESVASRSEMLGHGTIGGEEALGMPWRLEPLHAPLPLPCGQVRVLGTVMQIPRLAVFHIIRHDNPTFEQQFLDIAVARSSYDAEVAGRCFIGRDCREVIAAATLWRQHHRSTSALHCGIGRQFRTLQVEISPGERIFSLAPVLLHVPEQIQTAAHTELFVDIMQVPLHRAFTNE
jgi:hypothetical protein